MDPQLKYPHDIFLSYARKNHRIANIFLDAFVTAGWDTYIDRQIETSAQWSNSLIEALEGSFRTVVLWDRDSVKSDWVQREARLALEKGTLYPVRLDDCEIPAEFAVVQHLDMRSWGGSAHDELMQRCIRQLWDGCLCERSTTRSFFANSRVPKICSGTTSQYGYTTAVKRMDGPDTTQRYLAFQFDVGALEGKARISTGNGQVITKGRFQLYSLQREGHDDTHVYMTCFHTPDGDYHLQLRRLQKESFLKIEPPLLARWFDPFLNKFVASQTIVYVKCFPFINVG